MKNKLLGYHAINTDLAALLLRLVFGGLFIYHGYVKIASYSQYLPYFPDLLGIGSKSTFLLVIFAEFVGGLLITAGFLTRLAVVPIFVTMIGAYFMAHAADPFHMKELPFAFMLLSPVVFVMGSGAFSVDRFIFKNKNTANSSQLQ